MFLAMAIQYVVTHFLASWNTVSSDQAGLALDMLAARRLCSQSRRVVMTRGKGFWLMLVPPATLGAGVGVYWNHGKGEGEGGEIGASGEGEGPGEIPWVLRTGPSR